MASILKLVDRVEYVSCLLLVYIWVVSVGENVIQYKLTSEVDHSECGDLRTFQLCWDSLERRLADTQVLSPEILIGIGQLGFVMHINLIFYQQLLFVETLFVTVDSVFFHSQLTQERYTQSKIVTERGLSMPRNIQPETPGEGQESVWDYPRPPRVEAVPEHIRIIFNGVVIADTHDAYRVLETSHPPSYYIPLDDINQDYLVKTDRSSFCEFKGGASYYTIRVDDKSAQNAAWYYASPSRGFEQIKDHVSFYASKMDACFVGDEQVQAQSGDFYGGWITSKVVGPFKGGPGTWGW